MRRTTPTLRLGDSPSQFYDDVFSKLVPLFQPEHMPTGIPLAVADRTYWVGTAPEVTDIRVQREDGRYQHVTIADIPAKDSWIGDELPRSISDQIGAAIIHDIARRSPLS